MVDDALPRCGWANESPSLTEYHDREWGRAPGSDAGYLEALTLEVFQAGLSWRTVLAKRDAFRRAFAGFDLDGVAGLSAADVERLLADPGIIRHRGKIVATIHNAASLCALRDEHGSVQAWFDRAPADPVELYRALRPRLAFFGPTTCESFLHAVGRVPAPHEPGCWLAR
ncbi:MAG TPA: DNA-3-methyladenine glycosylase I [Thermomicrobiaceae bacterium]|nr:DNA-3-methyladenine glycosylase I [Thermomicrobiaceae bacterium]